MRTLSNGLRGMWGVWGVFGMRGFCDDVVGVYFFVFEGIAFRFSGVFDV